MEKKKKKGLSLKAILQFVVLCAGATSIYMPVVSRTSFYDAFIESFQVNNTQFATMFSTYTLFTLLTYFLGGVAADKIPPRKLLAFSFLSTGALTFWQLQFPSYGIAVFIYGAMGVTTTLTFWAALIKATRQFGQMVGGESKALGALEGGRAITNMLLSTFCVWLFARAASSIVGLRSTLIVYCVALIICGVGAWFVFDDDEQSEEAVSKDSLPKLILECMKNKYVWVCCFVVMGAYAMTSTLNGYVSSIANACFSLSAVAAAAVTVIGMYVQPFGSFGGGWLGDKIGASKTIILSVAGLIITSFIITVLPSNAAMTVPFVIVYLFFAIFMSSVRGQFYAPLREIGIPMYLSGTAIGLIATIGYSPDFFLLLITGCLLDTMDPVAAYKIVIYILIAFGVFSMLMASVIVSYVKKNEKAKEGTE